MSTHWLPIKTSWHCPAAEIAHARIECTQPYKVYALARKLLIGRTYQTYIQAEFAHTITVYVGLVQARLNHRFMYMYM